MSEQAQLVDNHAGLDETKICYWKNNELDCWFIYLPGCGAGRLSEHKIEEHEDGTITVSPSILMRGHNNGNPTERHEHLVHGTWTEC